MSFLSFAFVANKFIETLTFCCPVDISLFIVEKLPIKDSRRTFIAAASSCNTADLVSDASFLLSNLFCISIICCCPCLYCISVLDNFFTKSPTFCSCICILCCHSFVLLVMSLSYDLLLFLQASC